MKWLYLTGDYTTRIQERFIYNPISNKDVVPKLFYGFHCCVYPTTGNFFFFKKNDLKKLWAIKCLNCNLQQWNVNDKKRKIWQKSVKLLNNNTNNYECLLKIMLYCPSSGHELLSTLGASLVFQVSSVFPVLKPPLPIIEAFSKSIFSKSWSSLIQDNY